MGYDHNNSLESSTSTSTTSQTHQCQHEQQEQQEVPSWKTEARKRKAANIKAAQQNSQQQNAVPPPLKDEEPTWKAALRANKAAAAARAPDNATDNSRNQVRKEEPKPAWQEVTLKRNVSREERNNSATCANVNGNGKNGLAACGCGCQVHKQHMCRPGYNVCMDCQHVHGEYVAPSACLSCSCTKACEREDAICTICGHIHTDSAAAVAVAILKKHQETGIQESVHTGRYLDIKAMSGDASGYSLRSIAPGMWTCCGSTDSDIHGCCLELISSLSCKCTMCGHYYVGWKNGDLLVPIKDPRCSYHSGCIILNRASNSYSWSCCQRSLQGLGCKERANHTAPSTVEGRAGQPVVRPATEPVHEEVKILRLSAAGPTSIPLSEEAISLRRVIEDRKAENLRLKQEEELQRRRQEELAEQERVRQQEFLMRERQEKLALGICECCISKSLVKAINTRHSQCAALMCSARFWIRGIDTVEFISEEIGEITPLQAATYYSDLGVVRALLAAGADIWKQSSRGFTAIFLASDNDVTAALCNHVRSLATNTALKDISGKLFPELRNVAERNCIVPTRNILQLLDTLCDDKTSLKAELSRIVAAASASVGAESLELILKAGAIDTDNKLLIRSIRTGEYEVVRVLVRAGNLSASEREAILQEGLKGAVDERRIKTTGQPWDTSVRRCIQIMRRGAECVWNDACCPSLLSAAVKEHQECALSLIDQAWYDARYTSTLSGNLSILQYVSKVGNLALLQKLLGDREIAHDPQQQTYNQPVVLAASGGHLECLTLLWSKYNHVPLTEQALIGAASGNFTGCVEFLLNLGCPGKETAVKVTAQKSYPNTLSLLLRTVPAGSPCIEEALDECLSERYTCNFRFFFRRESDEVARLLILNGAQVKVKHLLPALEICSTERFLDILSRLQPAAITRSLFEDLIMNVTAYCDVTLLRALFSAQPYAIQANSEFMTKLLFTAIYSNEPRQMGPTLEFLLSNGASRTQAYEGTSPMVAAVASNQVDACRALINAGENVNSVIEFTADLRVSRKTCGILCHAVSVGSVEVVQLLLERGATTDSWLVVKSESANCGITRSALHVAAQDGNAACVEVLLRHGADKNATDLRGRKPVEVASGDNVRALLSS
ncbi:hypothetical protein Pelo_16892 [Pelomyxa schiedti]|nr:hypothetical protein Pelo_16892 [Pelomyxa schiedti]